MTAFLFDGFKDVRIEEGVTQAGVNRELALARASLNWAVERRLIPYSPFAGVKLFDEAKHRKRPKILSFAEEARLLPCCDLRLQTVVVALLEAGLRVGEALALMKRDVDFSEGTITVVRSKTAAGLRIIPMTELCKTQLLKWHAATTGISEYVFFNPQRPTTHIRSVKTAWHNALKAAKLAPLPLYNCRHAYATRLAGAGVSDAIIDQLLGHSRRDILSFYTARVSENLRDAVSRLEQLRRNKADLTTTGNPALPLERHIVKGSTLVQ